VAEQLTRPGGQSRLTLVLCFWGQPRDLFDLRDRAFSFVLNSDNTQINKDIQKNTNRHS